MYNGPTAKVKSVFRNRSKGLYNIDHKSNRYRGLQGTATRFAHGGSSKPTKASHKASKVLKPASITFVNLFPSTEEMRAIIPKLSTQKAKPQMIRVVELNTDIISDTIHRIFSDMR
jgi:hypothetical protein